MRYTAIALMLAGLGAAGLYGCDVKKTQEGNVTVPKYEVEKKQSGDVTLPKYDVTAPDVNVSKTEKEVTVPKVTTEKETITLPKVEVTPADKKADEKTAQKPAEQSADKKY
jgi:hypothetical protein